MHMHHNDVRVQNMLDKGESRDGDSLEYCKRAGGESHLWPHAAPRGNSKMEDVRFSINTDTQAAVGKTHLPTERHRKTYKASNIRTVQRQITGRPNGLLSTDSWSEPQAC